MDETELKAEAISITAESIQIPNHCKDINMLADNMFNKIADFIQSDLNSTVEDYDTLIDINSVASRKYQDMRETTQGIANNMIELNEKFVNLQKYLLQIDKLDDSITVLEQMAYRVDAYSKRLESHFKSLEKSN